MYPATKMVTSLAGKIAYWDTEKEAPALLFIHGNSACKEAFIHQFDSPSLQDYRLVVLDFPGHGESDDYPNALEECTISSFAEIVSDVICRLNLKNPTMIGWSLGGHIGIEMLGQGVKLSGLVLSGTPPCGPGLDDIGSAFTPSPHMALTGKEVFTDEDVQQYADHMYGLSKPIPKKLMDNIKRTQGAVRTGILGNFMTPGSAHGQKTVVATSKVPIAVLQGKNDSFMGLEYLESLKWNSLWRDKVAVVQGAGHAPFWEKPEEYNNLILEFLLFTNR